LVTEYYLLFTIYYLLFTFYRLPITEYRTPNTEMLTFVRAWLLYTWGGLHRYFGNMNSMASEHERAVHYFSRAYTVDPTFRRARLARAVLYFRELGQPQAALADLNALLDEDPAYDDALLNRAMLAQQDGRYQEALTDLQTYLALDNTTYSDEARRMADLLQALLDEDET
jgi:tetratricopeptide (TPR) repeat protein